MKLTIPLNHAAKILRLMSSFGTFTQIVNWQAYLADCLGLARGEYFLRLKNGGVITIPANTPAKWPVQEILLDDEYRLLSLKKERLRTIIDLGASIGVFSIYAAWLFPKARILAFEPHQPSFRLLCKNIGDNSLQRRTTSFPLACYSPQAVVALRHPTPDKIAGLKGPAWVFGFKRAITLQEILSQNRISRCDLLKIDVEGAEYDILYSLSDDLYSRIKRIHLEYHNLDPSGNLNGRSLKRFLETKKYRVIQDHRRLRRIGMLFAVRQWGR